MLRALADAGYEKPTPIQQKAIPPILAGRDLLGCAQTGTGKTAAFALPILHHLTRQPAPKGRRPTRCLVLAPTRELAAQIEESFRDYGRHTDIRQTVIFGGVGQRPQEQALRQGVDVVVATPGRLMDLMDQGHVKLDQVEIFVLDEADRMLDMGFLPAIRKITSWLPDKKQTLLLSATVPAPIRALAGKLLHDPVEVAVAATSSAAETVEQSVYFVDKDNKRALLEHLINEHDVYRALVFTRTKHGADRVAKTLVRADIGAEAIHGNKSQNARIRALGNFKSGKTRVLVASDIAARGLDIDDVTHVINFDLPNEPETYVHRIGRTGRAGATGEAFSLCDGTERAYLRDIEKLTKTRVPVVHEHPYPAQESEAEAIANAKAKKAAQPPRPPRPGRGRPQPARAKQAVGGRPAAGNGARGSRSSGDGGATSDGPPRRRRRRRSPRSAE